MKVQLTEDVISNNKKTVYGKKGEHVTMIHEEENVLIVESKDGNRFPVHISKVKVIDK